jgi:hypothetical protein
MIVGTSLPFAPIGPLLGFIPLPLRSWPLLASILLGYRTSEARHFARVGLIDEWH